MRLFESPYGRDGRKDGYPRMRRTITNRKEPKDKYNCGLWRIRLPPIAMVCRSTSNALSPVKGK